MNNFQRHFNTLTNVLLLVLLISGGLVWAESNGVWHYAEDVRGGTFGSDEVVDNFTFADPVYIMDKLGVNTYNPAVTLDVNGSVCSKYSCLDNLLDVDADGKISLQTDGMLIERYMQGFTGNALTDGVVSPFALRSDPAEIRDYLDSLGVKLDVDGNGEVDALTDGLLIGRWIDGVRGSDLTSGAVGVDAIRTTSAQLEAYFEKTFKGGQYSSLLVSNGNVGIGTSEPVEALHVDGNVLVEGNVTSNNIFMSGVLCDEDGVNCFEQGDIININNLEDSFAKLGYVEEPVNTGEDIYQDPPVKSDEITEDYSSEDPNYKSDTCDGDSGFIDEGVIVKDGRYTCDKNVSQICTDYFIVERYEGWIIKTLKRYSYNRTVACFKKSILTKLDESFVTGKTYYVAYEEPKRGPAGFIYFPSDCFYTEDKNVCPTETSGQVWHGIVNRFNNNLDWEQCKQNVLDATSGEAGQPMWLVKDWYESASECNSVEIDGNDDIWYKLVYVE